MTPDPPAAPPPPDRRRPLFRAPATTFVRVGFIGLVLAVTATAFAVWQYHHSPYWTRVGYAPEQPVLFSHRHHAGELRIDCRYCHDTVETSAFAGMPTTRTCLNCHSRLFTDTAMLRPVVHSATTGEPLAWNRVTRLPDHVFFNHSIHLAKGVGCITCHGELGDMALTAKAESLDMRWCLDCHRDPAPRLQAADTLFAATRPAGANKSSAASAPSPAELMRANAVHPQHLTNCSTCHR